MVDIHLHILPGVDDGPRTLDESLRLAEELVSQGVRKAAATPHWGRLSRYSSLEEIKEGFLRVKESLEKAGIPLELCLGFEIFLNLETLEDIKKLGRQLGLSQTSYFLVEFPFQFIYPNWDYLLSSIKDMGLRPIIAHPERYSYILTRPSILEEMVSMGALAQVNAESLVGVYGKEIKRFSRNCIKDGLCHLVASDAHGLSGRPPYISEAKGELEGILGEEELREIFEERPAAVLAGEEIWKRS